LHRYYFTIEEEMRPKMNIIHPATDTPPVRIQQSFRHELSRPAPNLTSERYSLPARHR